VNRSDADRLLLLDRLAERVPELDLDRNEIEWKTLPDGHEALLERKILHEQWFADRTEALEAAGLRE
jgi:hypothetical protein